MLLVHGGEGRRHVAIPYEPYKMWQGWGRHSVSPPFTIPQNLSTSSTLILSYWFKGKKFFAREPSESPPPARQRGAEQKNCLFLLEEKNRRVQNQKMMRQFFCEARLSEKSTLFTMIFEQKNDIMKLR